MRLRFCTLVVLLSLFGARDTVARTVTRGLVDASAAAGIGLNRSWTARVPVHGKISHMILTVDDSRRFQAFEVKYGDRTRYFSARTVDRSGNLLGADAARLRADDVLQTQQALGQSPVVQEREFSEFTLYVQTDRGVLQAIDAETGRVRWSARVGQRDYPSMSPAANNKYVATISGSRLYLLYASDGRVAWDKLLEGIPVAGPAISSSMVFVPTLRGTIEAYQIEDRKAPSLIYRFSDRPSKAPVASDASVCWTTEKGSVYVSPADTLTARFRIQTQDAVYAGPAFQRPKTWFAASNSGQVYSIDEEFGHVKWQILTGRPTSQAPIPIGDSLYVVTEHDGVYSLAADTGALKWMYPRATRFVAASEDRTYCAGTHGELLVLDSNSGKLLNSLSAVGMDLGLANSLTDRLYVGESRGFIYCLHESKHHWPLRHVPYVEPAKVEAVGEPTKPTEDERADEPSKTEEAPADDIDPFGFDTADDADFGFDQQAPGPEADDQEMQDDSSADDDDPFADLDFGDDF